MRKNAWNDKASFDLWCFDDRLTDSCDCSASKGKKSEVIYLIAALIVARVQSHWFP